MNYISLQTSLQTEFLSVANGATKKEIVRAIDYIQKHLELEMGQLVETGTVHAGDLMVSLFTSFW